MIINQSLGGGDLNLTGTTDQVVGFDANGKPTAVSKEELRGPQGIQGPTGATGAQGPQGPAGAAGADGATGKTAYQYAVDGGYTGTEEKFQQLLGTGPWLPLSGGVMIGSIKLGAQGELYRALYGPYLGLSENPSNVFPSVGDKRFGFVATGNPLKSAASRLLLVDTPVEDTDAANKKYVDEKAAAAAGVPSRSIIMWSGSINEIPSGWVLCNGQNGTPDLRDRFIVGAGSSYGVGATGGSAQVTLTESQMPSHRHSNNLVINYTPGGAGQFFGPTVNDNFSQGTSYTNYTGGNMSHENRPPYYALCFIMKQ